VVVIEGAGDLAEQQLVVDALLRQMERARNNVRVILTGELQRTDGRDLATLLRLDGMDTVFVPTNLITIADFTAAQISTVAREHAAAAKRISFAPGLEEALAGYIDFEFGSNMRECGAGHLARKLVDQAYLMLIERFFNAGPSAAGPSETFIRADFPAESVGGPKSEKDEIDTEVDIGRLHPIITSQHSSTTGYHTFYYGRVD
jgi:hypothetical protein